RDVHLSSNMVEPYLDVAWLPSCPAPGGDVDHAALFQNVLYLRIHTSSPIAMPCVRHSQGQWRQSRPAWCLAWGHQEWHKPGVNGRAVPVPGTSWCYVVAVCWIRRITVVVL